MPPGQLGQDVAVRRISRCHDPAGVFPEEQPFELDVGGIAFEVELGANRARRVGPADRRLGQRDQQAAFRGVVGGPEQALGRRLHQE